MMPIADAFLKNRADNLPPDVSQEFIVPPFFKEISIFSDSKSVRVLGGRGCGKTMFLRYFCHGSTFSEKRESIDDSEFSNVGLYFRPDIGFCSLMAPSWLANQKDGIAFSHYLTLCLVQEACQAIRSITAARNLSAGPLDLSGIKLGVTLAKQLQLQEPTFEALEQSVEERLATFDLWVRNPDRCEAPQFVHFTNILIALAADLAKHSSRLKTFAFRVFIDEFENLLPRQREIVCDAIKHPQPRLAVHIAHKREAVTDFKTSGEERIVETHDIRTIDIEKQLLKDGYFELLAAELFLFKLYPEGTDLCPAFRSERLHDPAHLPHRLSAGYRQDILGFAKQILPEMRAPEIAREALRDGPLRRRVTDFIKKGLELQGLDKHVDADDLISEDFAEATVVLGAILNRRSQSGRDALGLFKALLKNGKTSGDPFYKTGGWVDNNLYGCLFHLYAGLPRRPNILYSGFSRFCTIASPNLRFFQELCHSTLLQAYQRQSADEIGGHLQVDQLTQAQAAQQVSDAMFEDIMQLGPYGDRLLDFARRLGRLFEGYNKRRSQSEPEINHFSINTADSVQLPEAAQTILREAKIWSVLWETVDTKNKAEHDASQFELVLNAIYAPHFKISYRKRRKITLTAAQLDIILTQSGDHFEQLLKQLVESQDDGEPAPQTGSLF
ncbi:ORC-CDC6 family AAA ATPase [Pseudomonas aeruginosa]